MTFRVPKMLYTEDSEEINRLSSKVSLCQNNHRYENYTQGSYNLDNGGLPKFQEVIQVCSQDLTFIYKLSLPEVTNAFPLRPFCKNNVIIPAEIIGKKIQENQGSSGSQVAPSQRKELEQEVKSCSLGGEIVCPGLSCHYF